MNDIYLLVPRRRSQHGAQRQRSLYECFSRRDWTDKRVQEIIRERNIKRVSYADVKKGLV